VLILLGAVAGLVGSAVAGGEPARLAASGPASVAGTPASAVFTIGDRTVRQVRYVDAGRLTYEFSLRNDGDEGATVTARAGDQAPARLFGFASLTDEDGSGTITVPAGGSERVVLALHMGGCETLSSRSGSFVESVVLRLADRPVEVGLPEHLHTGSPREASCPDSTATSRPQG
jgi:hypothetical protein